MIKTLKEFFRAVSGETYFKERVFAFLGVLMYGVGNLIEYFSGKITSDPVVVWVTGLLISIILIWVSLSKWKKFTQFFFRLLIFFGNVNIVYAYGESTHGNIESEALYLLFTYAIFVVSSQFLSTRKDIILLSIVEALSLTIVVLVYREQSPLLISPFHQLMFLFVVAGNFFIGIQRLRLTQVTGGSNIQFRMLSESARDVQSIIDKSLSFIYINPSIQQLSGYSQSDLFGKSLQLLINDEEKENVDIALNMLQSKPEKRQSAEYRIKRADGSLVWVESIFSLFKPDPNLSKELIFCETRDIESRKELENEIKFQLEVESILIEHSNNFINVERTEIQHGVDQALKDFASILNAENIVIYRIFGNLMDEFRLSNKFSVGEDPDAVMFNSSVLVNQEILSFLRSLRKNSNNSGSEVAKATLENMNFLSERASNGKQFYLVPLNSGNSTTGLVFFVFNQPISTTQLNLFGLIGNMMANAFTRLRTEMRLHEAQLTNEFILRALPDWLYIINSKAEFTGSNNYSTLSPFIPDYELSGKTFSDVLPAEASKLFSDALSRVIETDLSATFEFEDTFIHKGKFFKVIIAPFKANEYLTIIRDVTDLRLAQSELELKARKLEVSNKELEEFAYIVSHDMKQPIRTIISYLTLLKKKFLNDLKEEAQEYVNFSIDGANKMSDLIRDILQYSKMEQELAVSNVDLTSVTKKVLGNLNDTITTQQATVEIEALPEVKGNETMLTELFQNLIENGIKYNTSDAKKITVKVSQEPLFWKFEVTDNGIGFEQQYADQIFKIFKRLHNDEEFQGTGIGLSICQKVVEKHGGRIWAISEKGKGSTFYFTLPRK